MNRLAAIQIRLLTLIFCLAFGITLSAESAFQNAPSPDNTRMNQHDRNANGPTADQQQNDKSDRVLPQQIRKAFTEDKSLSSDAHNVKVITQDGQVTLKGPVRSEQEKQALESKAAAIAGEGKVTSDLMVKSSY